MQTLPLYPLGTKIFFKSTLQQMKSVFDFDLNVGFLASNWLDFDIYRDIYILAATETHRSLNGGLKACAS